MLNISNYHVCRNGGLLPTVCVAEPDLDVGGAGAHAWREA